MLLVYLPAALVGAIILEPLGIPELLADIPFPTEGLLLTALVGFYYLLAVLIVNVISFVRGEAAQ